MELSFSFEFSNGVKTLCKHHFTSEMLLKVSYIFRQTSSTQFNLYLVETGSSAIIFRSLHDGIPKMSGPGTDARTQTHEHYCLERRSLL